MRDSKTSEGDRGAEGTPSTPDDASRSISSSRPAEAPKSRALSSASTDETADAWRICEVWRRRHDEKCDENDRLRARRLAVRSMTWV
jgi:hypothetical protein